MLPEQQDQTIDELIQGSTQVEIPVEVQDRMRRRLTEFRAKVEQRPPDRWRAFTASLFHFQPVRIVAMAAVLLVILGAGMVLIPTASRANRVFAAAAEQLRASRSLRYTIVLNASPYVAVDFSYLAPGYRRIHCSWGIEVRTDGVTSRQIVLMHAARAYLLESGKQVESQANIEDFAEQLRSLPQQADEGLGEQWTGRKRLVGYRLRKAPPNGGIPGLQSLDIWIDPETRQADHVEINVQEPGKPAHQMQIRDIRADVEIDRSIFDLTPPAGYTAFLDQSVQVQAHITVSTPLLAVVMPMQGPYSQTQSALQAVESYLKTIHAAPAGPPFGRYPSEQGWEAGYPVAHSVSVHAPFQLVSLPATLTASAVVSGAWGQGSTSRWVSFLKSVGDLGYVPAGPAMEIWLGQEAQPSSQSTEMRMTVTPKN